MEYSTTGRCAISPPEEATWSVTRKRSTACEINSSFYRPHKKETWERWARSVPAEFRFSVKAPRTITHEAKLNCSSEVLSAFLEQIEFLREKLGSGTDPTTTESRI